MPDIKRPTFTAFTPFVDLGRFTVPNPKDFVAPQTEPEKTRVAWVFGGGGARGSFQAGVARFLTRGHILETLKPDEIHGSSTGSLTSIKMAEHPIIPAAASLIALYRALDTHSDMWTPTPRFKDVVGAVNRSVVDAGGESTSTLSLLGVEYGRQTVWQSELGPRSNQTGPDASGFSDPVVDTLTASFDFVVELPHLLRRIGGFVDLALGAGDRFAEIKRAWEEENAVASLSPIKALLLKNVSSQRIARSGVALRMTAVDMPSGESIWCTETGDILTAEGLVDHNAESTTAALVDGAIASSSIPIFFRPKHLATKAGGLWCSDGGIRDIMPTQLLPDFVARAREQERQPVVVAVYADAVKPLSPVDWKGGDKSAVDVLTRTLSVLVDEVVRGDVRELHHLDARLIEIAPTAHLMTAIVVEPGLIDINIGHGYMAAFDAIGTVSDDDFHFSGSSNHLITTKRHEAWKLERRHVSVRAKRIDLSALQALPAVVRDLLGLEREILRVGSVEASRDLASMMFDEDLEIDLRHPELRHLRQSLFVKVPIDAGPRPSLFPANSNDPPRHVVAVKPDLVRRWRALGRSPEHIVLWTPGTIEAIRDLKNEIADSLRLRHQNFTTHSAPIEDVDGWVGTFERHTELESLVLDVPFTPWVAQIDTNLAAIPAADQMFSWASLAGSGSNG